jgi:hypothetical protein
LIVVFWFCFCFFYILLSHFPSILSVPFWYFSFFLLLFLFVVRPGNMQKSYLVISVFPCMSERLLMDGFSRNFVFAIFTTICRLIPTLVNIGQKGRHIYMLIYVTTLWLPFRLVSVSGKNCFLCEVQSEAEETVEHRAWWIVNFEYRRLTNIDFTPNLSHYGISMMAHYTSVPMVQENRISCVKVLSFSPESLHKESKLLLLYLYQHLILRLFLCIYRKFCNVFTSKLHFIFTVHLCIIDYLYQQMHQDKFCHCFLYWKSAPIRI